ncbi:unnamed protein product, partial [marine sediment metagenome]
MWYHRNYKESQRTYGSVGSMAAKLFLGSVLLGLFCTGCADHRISLTDFMEMQQQIAQDAAPQPATAADV